MSNEAILHKGRTWWVIEKDAWSFSQMRNGFRTRDEALNWALSNGYRIAEETEAA